MKKIPVIPTIQAAYRFVFTHLGAIIGLIWLPMLLVTVIGFFVKQRYYAAAADALASNSYASLGPSQLTMLCYYIAALLLYAMMFVPVVQLAQGQRKEGALLHFSFGSAEWRLFRALVGFVAFLILPVIIAAFLFRSVMAFAVPGRSGVPLAGMGLEVLALLAILGVMYVALRFAFLLPAVAVSEEGPVLPRTWKLSAGNFWRILAVALATAVPVRLIAAIAESLMGGPQMLTPSAAGSSALAAAMLHNASLNMPVSQGIEFLIAPLIIGLTASASALSLSALKDEGARPTLPL